MLLLFESHLSFSMTENIVIAKSLIDRSRDVLYILLGEVERLEERHRKYARRKGELIEVVGSGTRKTITYIQLIKKERDV